MIGSRGPNDPTSPTSPTSPPVRFAAMLMIATALAIAAGRIALVISPEGDTAFLSANDRSRWATVAALVEDGTYAIDRLIAIRDATGKRRPWQTIDRVRHTASDGRMHDYSSKPPLFSTLVAGVYGVVRGVTGASLTENPIGVARVILALVNLPLLATFLVAVWRSIRVGYGEWAALAGLATASFGSMVLPMSITLGNHLPAAAATAVVLAIYLARTRAAGEQGLSGGLAAAAVAGGAAAFTVSCELPALSMFVLWGILFWLQDRKSTWLGFAGGAAVIAAGFFGTNWLAHRTLIPPYAHRSDGPVIATAKAPAGATEDQLIEAIRGPLSGSGEIHPRNREGATSLLPTRSPDRWVIEVGGGNQRFALIRRGADAGKGDAGGRDAGSDWEIRRWDRWYEYPGSYWITPRRGVDRGEPSRSKYAFHATFGHHGIFSLTPFWLLFPIGLWMHWKREWLGSGWGRWREAIGRLVAPGAGGDRRAAGDRLRLAVAIALSSGVCFLFYISRPLIDRNYGGVSCCFRWLIWFTPLWIWASLPAAEMLSRRGWGRWLLGLLVVGGAFSAATALQSPWRHPWIYRYFEFLGWIGG